MNQAFDVIVIGGGPAGCAAAISLVKSGKKVALIDGGLEPEHKIGESLPPAVHPVLKHLGLLEVLKTGGHAISYGNLSAWGSSDLIATDFIRDPQGHGWLLNRGAFDRDLRNHAEVQGVIGLRGWIRTPQRKADHWDVIIGRQTATADWIIDATGRGAIIARKIGAKRYTDDSLVALYAYITSLANDQIQQTLVESAADGWWYSALLPGAKRIVTFMTDNQRAKSLQKDSARWLKMVGHTNHVLKLVEGADWVTPLHLTESCGTFLDQCYGDGWLAVGDAAMAFDPLASQGIFNALYSGMRGGEAVAEFLSGDCSALVGYQQRMQEIRGVYLQRRSYFYQQERRWVRRRFWQTKQAFQSMVSGNKPPNTSSLL